MKKPKNAKAAKQRAEPKKRGRPPGSGKKAAAAPKQTKAEKTKAAAEKRQAAQQAVAGSNSVDPTVREAFLGYLKDYRQHKERMKSANGRLRAFLKEAKRDGFIQNDFDTAILVETPEGEARVREDIGRLLRAAQMGGSTLGNQLDLFNEPDRTPAVDIARSEGQKASMENKAALPPYDPSTPQYRAYMEGFHEHQATLASFKAINPAETGGKAAKPAKAPKAAKAEKAPAAPPAAPEAPKPSATVVPITRAQVIAQQAQGERLGDVDADEADGEEGGGEGFGGGEDADEAVSAGGFARRQ